MWCGKKALAQRIFYDALDEISKKVKDKNPIDVFNSAIANVKPIMEVRPKRVGGATYQVPMEVTPKRQLSLSMRWIIQAARKKKGKPMSQKLADEILAAYNNQGDAITTRANVHKMADANKAFAHFAYFRKRKPKEEETSANNYQSYNR